MIGKSGMYMYGFARTFWSFVIGFILGAIVAYLLLKGIITIPYIQ